MRARFLIPLTLLLLSEFYTFIAVRAVVRPLPPLGRRVLLVLYVILTVGLYLLMLNFRRIDWDAFPPALRTLVISFSMGFAVAKIVILLFGILEDLVRGFRWIWGTFSRRNLPVEKRDFTISRSLFLQRSALAVGGFMVALLMYGTTNRYKYHTRRLKLKFPNFPSAFNGLKIVQISDIHSGSFDNEDAVAAGIARVLAEKPDLILFTGDLVNNVATEVGRYQEILGRLSAPMGVFSTLGNHDYGDYAEWPNAAAKKANLDHLKDIHAQMGWNLMMNEHRIFEKGGEQFALIGIENWGAKAGFPKYGDMRAATAGLNPAITPFSLLMSHDPSHWEAQVQPEYPYIDLTLSGHTHGMQFGVDIPGLKWSPVQWVYKQWAGLYQQGKQRLYVNRGFGFIGYPGRVGIMPEITVLTLEQGS